MKTLLLGFGLFFPLFSFANELLQIPPVSTLPFVEVEKYLGTWYEVAAIPQSFQKQCAKNTTAVYAEAEDGLISVLNTCETKSGKTSKAQGRAKIVDKNTNSKLKVTFVNFLGWQFLLGGDYWIIGLGENYSYAVVGSPGRDYAWILSRTQHMNFDDLTAASASLKAQGFDTCKLLTSVQDSGFSSRTPLCQIVTEL